VEGLLNDNIHMQEKSPKRIPLFSLSSVVPELYNVYSPQRQRQYKNE